MPWGLLNIPILYTSSLFIILFYSCYSCSERIQSPFDVLIATVYLLYVVDAADAVRTHGSYQQGDARTAPLSSVTTTALNYVAAT
jgi:hypothetical protein